MARNGLQSEFVERNFAKKFELFSQNGTEYERIYTRVELHKPGGRVKIKSPHADSQETVIYCLEIDKGFQNFRYTARLKTKSALQTCSSAAYQYNH